MDMKVLNLIFINQSMSDNDPAAQQSYISLKHTTDATIEFSVPYPRLSSKSQLDRDSMTRLLQIKT